ncbi:MAG: M48 family metallopeptidase [Eggerthellaceae bacterium]|nr:M48 family metallopeptidase [Eggerthellaceae bacterium]
MAGMDVLLIRKRVKNVNLRVRKDGQVSVSAPYHVPLPEIERFVASKRDWILAAKDSMANASADPLEQASKAEREAWKQVVMAFVPPLIQKWEPVLGVKAGKLAYRNMKSRWGSCQPSTGRICINTRLALYPPECLEYVVVHELCHLLERGHGPGFYALLDAALPDWKDARARLKRPPSSSVIS